MPANGRRDLIRRLKFKESVKIRTNYIVKRIPTFSLREWKPNETNVAEGYCWTITEAAGRLCYHRSHSSVLQFGFKLDSPTIRKVGECLYCRRLSCFKFHVSLNALTYVSCTEFVSAWEIKDPYSAPRLTSRQLRVKVQHIIWRLVNEMPKSYNVSRFRRVRKTVKTTISFIMSVCPSVISLGTTRRPLNGF